MSQPGPSDPRDPTRPAARDEPDPQHGAVYGEQPRHAQPNAWPAAKVDTKSEADLAREERRRGEPPATPADEAFHGAPLAHTPERLGELKRTGVQETAAGIPAIAVSMKYVLEELGPVQGLRMLGKINQTDGFDCQSCAWPDPAPGKRSSTEFCENGAKVTAEENTRKLIPPDFFRRHSVEELSRRSDHWLQEQGRLGQPMLLREGATHYEPVSWDEALRTVARALNALGSPDEATFYTSGRTSNEAAFLYQLFVRQFGTNNLPDCSNMCHESSGAALTDAIGIGKGTVTLEDVETTELLIDIGHNPGTCHPRMLTSLQTAKRNGAKIVAVNPLPETGLNHFKHPQDLKHPLRALNVLVGPGTALADLYLPVRIGGDMALLKGILKEMLEEEDRRPGEVFDHAFIREHTSGYEELVADLRREEWEVIVEQSGIPREEIRRVAGLVTAHQRIIVAWGMGLTQQPEAVGVIQQVVNLLLLRGSIGKPGAGVLPVRGHSNVQGDRTVGIWERMPPEFLAKVGREFGFEPPQHHGLDTVESLRAMHAGRVKVFFAMGGNFLQAGPDTEYAAEAMRRCALTAHVSIKLNRSHLVTGRQALILPTLGRAERDVQAGGPQFVTVENSMGIVSRSQGVLPPAAQELRSEVSIVAGLARATLGERTTVDWEGLAADYDRIRGHIEHVVPGFDDYNRRVREPGGFYLPNLARDRRQFTTTTGRANFTVHPIPRVTLEPGQLIMTSLRSHDQFNTTVYGMNDRYRGIHNERRVVLMNPDDIREMGLESGEVVDLTSHFRGERRVARRFIVVPYPIPRRCAATYYPEMNVLVPIGSVAARSNTPTSKFVVVTVHPAPRPRRARHARADEGRAAPDGRSA